MRILFVSNLFPPHHLGGYELGCSEAVAGLKARGHDVRVLTSSYGVGAPRSDGDVYRWLKFTLSPQSALKLLRQEMRNQRAFRRVVKEFSPDIVYFWNVTGISLSLAQIAERLRIPTCFYVFDLWMSRWRKLGWFAFWPHSPRRFSVRVGSRVLAGLLEFWRVLPPAVPHFNHVHFASGYLKNEAVAAGEQVANPEVIHWGIDLNDFPFEGEKEHSRLLFVGQLYAEKGVHTAIEAIRILVQRNSLSNLKLSIVGGSVNPEYATDLQHFVRDQNLDQNVEFVGEISRARLPEVYQRHDILIFPSIVDEGLGLALIEAMASGLAVVGTASGGSAEILLPEETGLVFPKEGAQTCADQIRRLINDPDLFERLRRSGRRRVEEEFRIETAVEKIERSLVSQVGLIRQ